MTRFATDSAVGQIRWILPTRRAKRRLTRQRVVAAAAGAAPPPPSAARSVARRPPSSGPSFPSEAAETSCDTTKPRQRCPVFLSSYTRQIQGQIQIFSGGDPRGRTFEVTRIYQHLVALCMFRVFGNRHGWLIPDNVRVANSFVHLSADWPSDYAAEHAQCHFMLIHPRM